MAGAKKMKRDPELTVSRETATETNLTWQTKINSSRQRGVDEREEKTVKSLDDIFEMVEALKFGIARSSDVAERRQTLGK